MASITFREVEGSSLKYWALLGGLGLFVLFGALAWNTMHHHGHVITGMDNQIVWGLPHVLAVFLIVAASGALNVASIALGVQSRRCTSRWLRYPRCWRWP